MRQQQTARKIRAKRMAPTTAQTTAMIRVLWLDAWCGAAVAEGDDAGEVWAADGEDDEAAVGAEEAEEDDDLVAAAEAEAELIMPTTELTPPINSFNALVLVVLWPNTQEAVAKASKADDNLLCHMLMRDKGQFRGRTSGSKSTSN